MRAILLDPRARTITEIQMEGDDYQETNPVLGSRSFTIGAYLNGSFSEDFDYISCSDDALEGRSDDLPRY